MNTRSWTMMRVLVNRFHKDNAEKFLKIFPQEESQMIRDQDVQSDKTSTVFEDPQLFIKNIHFSWFLESFEKIPKELQPLMVASLSEAQARGISKYLQITPAEKPPRKVVKTFLLEMLYKAFNGTKALPLEFLPPGPLNFLATFKKNDLIELIDFLGMYDLADQIRHIVDRKYLKDLYNCLNPKKQQFLRICLQQKDKLASPKLELESAYGDCQKLEKILHRRGMFRLAKALSGQPLDLIWHISHVLDTGRSALFHRYWEEKQIPGVVSILSQQVMNVLNFLNKKSTL